MHEKNNDMHEKFNIKFQEGKLKMQTDCLLLMKRKSLVMLLDI